MTTWAKLNFLDAASPVIEQIISFHDFTILILVLILTTVGYGLSVLILSPYVDKNTIENQALETIWTIIPAVILVFVALPSLKILYLTDEANNPAVTLRAIGHQWYWSYELPGFDKTFSSYMNSPEGPDAFRLLDVDARVALPVSTSVRVLVTASDVIHSWTVQPLGVKIDAVPGRLNQSSMTAKLPGLFFGQCSEICGANHSFIPIALEICPVSSFVSWVKTL